MGQFFGYGSLVNRATHDYPGTRRARLAGWRRVWVHTPSRPVAFLSVEPAPGVVIDGLLAEVPGGDWAALDAREHAYVRRPVLVETEAGPAQAQVYAVPDPARAEPIPAHPVLLSYLDTVVQGFLREWGVEGVRGFFATTAGWDAPLLDDRAAPLYPRHRALSRAETALVDAELGRIGVTVIGSAGRRPPHPPTGRFSAPRNG